MQIAKFQRRAILIICFLVLISLGTYVTPLVNDGNFEIGTDKETYYFAPGDNEVLCNVTKLNDAHTEENVTLDVTIQDNELVNITSVLQLVSDTWVPLEITEVTTALGTGLRITNSLQTYNTTNQYKFILNTPDIASSGKLWVDVNSTYTGQTTLDPYFYAINGSLYVDYDSLCLNETYEFNNETQEWNVTYQENFNCTCDYITNDVHTNESYYNHLSLSTCTQYVWIADKKFYPANVNTYCKEDSESQVTCDSRLDGNGDGTCNPGESCIVFYHIEDGIEYVSQDHYKELYENYISGLQ